MRGRKEQEPEKKNIPVLMLKFLIAAYFITGILLILLAMLLYKFRISDGFVTAGIVVTYIVSTFLTGFLAGKRMEQQKYLWGLCIGALYFAVLAVVSLLVRQSFEQISGNFPFTLFICLASGMLGGMLS